MHYFIGVILPFKYEGEKLDDALAEILKPWDENDGENEHGEWDWWALGGRWHSVWSHDYDPARDPANIETGGYRTGELKWPTKWVRRDDLNVIEVSRLINDTTLRAPYAICAAPDIWIAKERWDGENFVPHIGADDWDTTARVVLNDYRDMFIAVVDIHS